MVVEVAQQSISMVPAGNNVFHNIKCFGISGISYLDGVMEYCPLFLSKSCIAISQGIFPVRFYRCVFSCNCTVCYRLLHHTIIRKKTEAFLSYAGESFVKSIENLKRVLPMVLVVAIALIHTMIIVAFFMLSLLINAKVL